MAFRLYHNPSGTVRKLDQVTGVTLVKLERGRVRVATDAPSGAYGMERMSMQAHYELTFELVYSLGSNDLKDFHCRLQEWIEHADRGAPVGIARDAGKAGLWPLTESDGTTPTVWTDGDTAFYLGADALGWESSPALAAGDLAMLESEPPEGTLWPFRVGGWLATTPITVSPATAAHSAPGGLAWCRHQDVYPYLYRAEADLSVPSLVLDHTGNETFHFRAKFVQFLPEVT